MSDFSNVLNDYIELARTTGTELSNESGISEATISRYRKGQRVPEKHGDIITSLTTAIVKISERNQVPLLFDEIYRSLNEPLTDVSSYSDLGSHLSTLLLELQVNTSEFAKALNYDTSYISRIRNGKRMPSDPIGFIDKTCDFILNKYTEEEELLNIAAIIGCNKQAINDRHSMLQELHKWFGSELLEEHNSLDGFLKNLDSFDLDDYIKSIKFDELKVPHVPFQLPTQKAYYGLDEMKQGELDFFKSTVLSKSKAPVFMCSDMPMEDMAEDIEFGKKWMYAIAMTIKKGHRINIIHNINRPFKEMMLGLESWIPIYMTGKVSPYYFKHIDNSVYHHLNYVSGYSALCGECINGFHPSGRYYLTNNKEELKYWTKYAENLLSKASPLMNIYLKEKSASFDRAYQILSHKKGARRHILSSLPLYTISDDLLIRILDGNGILVKDRKQIIEFVQHERETTIELLANSNISDELPFFSREEFAKTPLTLPLSKIFNEKEIVYTYEEYLEHKELCEEFADTYEYYFASFNRNQAFKNINIEIMKNGYVLISKGNHPSIHFVITHPKMVNAFWSFTVPVVDEQ